MAYRIDRQETTSDDATYVAASVSDVEPMTTIYGDPFAPDSIEVTYRPSGNTEVHGNVHGPKIRPDGSLDRSGDQRMSRTIQRQKVPTPPLDTQLSRAPKWVQDFVREHAPA